MLVDGNRNDISSYDAIGVCGRRNRVMFFLSTQSFAASYGTHEECRRKPNPKGFRAEHEDFLLSLTTR